MTDRQTDRQTNKSNIKTAKNKCCSRLAFTLAEVLITLAIIGVVASITIPTLVHNYQKTQYLSSLKKFYTNFSQILLQVSADEGCASDLRCTGLFATGTNHQTLGLKLIPYFKVAKDCGVATGQGCWSASANNNYDGSSVAVQTMDSWTAYKFITTDGMSVSINNLAPTYLDCATPTWSNGTTGNMTQTCGYIYVDVNGPKYPNYFGIDVFGFWLTNGKGIMLYPRGGSDDKYSGTDHWWNGTNKACQVSYVNGIECPGRIMEEGWQMNY